MAKNRPENVFLGKNCFDFGSMHIKVYLEDFVQLLILCKQNSTKSALKQVFLLIFRVKIRRYGLGPKTKNVRHVEKNKI